MTEKTSSDWEITVMEPEVEGEPRRAHTIKIDALLLDLTATDKATKIGHEVETLIRNLLDA